MRSVSCTYENNEAKNTVKKGSVFKRNRLSMARLDMHFQLVFNIISYIEKTLLNCHT